MASAVMLPEEVEHRAEVEHLRASEHEEWRPSVSPWLIAISVILPMFMEVLDTTIANVALNNIAGSMSASYSQATWSLPRISSRTP